MCSLAGDIPPLSPPPPAHPPTVGVYTATVCQPLWICNLPFQFLASPFHRSSKRAVSANFTAPFHSQRGICIREITKPNTVWLSSEGHALLFMLNRCENASLFFFLYFFVWMHCLKQQTENQSIWFSVRFGLSSTCKRSFCKTNSRGKILWKLHLTVWV